MGLPDTITDIMLDSGGAILAALLNLRGLHEQALADPASKRRAAAHRAAKRRTARVE